VKNGVTSAFLESISGESIVFLGARIIGAHLGSNNLSRLDGRVWTPLLINSSLA
jgi:hypothetical protein